jgi:hypothetical protein
VLRMRDGAVVGEADLGEADLGEGDPADALSRVLPLEG